MLWTKHDQSRKVETDTFTQTTQGYSFRQNRDFKISSVNRMYHGSKSISFLGPKNWEIVSVKVDEFKSPNTFKKKSEIWYHKIVPARFASNI